MTVWRVLERERDWWRAECHKRTEEMHRQHVALEDLRAKLAETERERDASLAAFDKAVAESQRVEKRQRDTIEQLRAELAAAKERERAAVEYFRAAEAYVLTLRQAYYAGRKNIRDEAIERINDLGSELQITWTRFRAAFPEVQG